MTFAPSSSLFAFSSSSAPNRHRLHPHYAFCAFCYPLSSSLLHKSKHSFHSPSKACFILFIPPPPSPSKSHLYKPTNPLPPSSSSPLPPSPQRPFLFITNAKNPWLHPFDDNKDLKLEYSSSFLGQTGRRQCSATGPRQPVDDDFPEPAKFSRDEFPLPKPMSPPVVPPLQSPLPPSPSSLAFLPFSLLHKEEGGGGEGQKGGGEGGIGWGIGSPSLPPLQPQSSSSSHNNN